VIDVDPKEGGSMNDIKVSDTNGSDTNDSVAELRALVAELAARVQTLEEVAAKQHPEVSEDILLAIAAACAAYLGKRATIKQVHLHRGGAWASQGRTAVQQSHADVQGARGERQTIPRLQARRGTK
jgi:methylmalonyl-CoA carboxyltransferase 12S subunit